MRILRKPDLLRITGLSASTIARLEERGEFPQRVRVGVNAVGWREDELVDWIGSLRRRRACSEIGQDRPNAASAGAALNSPAPAGGCR